MYHQMKAQLSWFVLFVLPIVNAGHIPHCKFVVEAPAVELLGELTTISGIYVYEGPMISEGGFPVMILSQKIEIAGKKNYHFDGRVTVPVRIIWKERDSTTWAFRFILADHRSELIIETESFFCIHSDSIVPEYWPIYDLISNLIVGWSTRTDHITRTTCNPDVGLLSYMPPTEDFVENELFQIQTTQEFKMAYECVRYLKQFNTVNGTNRKPTAASLDVERKKCLFWHQPHSDIRFEKNGSTDRICFLEDSEPETSQDVKTTPDLEGDMLNEFFSHCLLVVFGSEEHSGPYQMNTTNNKLTQRKLIKNKTMNGAITMGNELSNALTYSPSEGVMMFDELDIYFKVDQFPCHPDNTDHGPFVVINQNSKPTELDSNPTELVVMVYTVTGRMKDFISCSGRRWDMNCPSWTSYEKCSFGPHATRDLENICVY